MKEVIIQPLSMYEFIVHPSFEDILPDGTGLYDVGIGDFVVMDNVPNRRKIVDISPIFNIIAPRDQSCDIIYKKVGSTALREIETREIIGATQMCKHEFYKGDLKDWLAKDGDTFGELITPFFLKATRTDLASNLWFGDVTRNATSTFSTNTFNGIVSWIKSYIANNTIKAAQTFTPAATNYRVAAGYAAAFAAIDNAYAQQTELMHNLPDLAKIIYCDEATLAGYNGYLRSLGTTSNYIDMYYAGGTKRVESYNGIPIKVVPMFGPVLNDILGAGFHHMVILTIRNNFVFATDKTYGEGPNNDEALVIWYERLDLSWRWQQFFKAGTQIALPEFIVFGISA